YRNFFKRTRPFPGPFDTRFIRIIRILQAGEPNYSTAETSASPVPIPLHPRSITLSTQDNIGLPQPTPRVPHNSCGVTITHGQISWALHSPIAPGVFRAIQSR